MHIEIFLLVNLSIAQHPNLYQNSLTPSLCNFQIVELNQISEPNSPDALSIGTTHNPNIGIIATEFLGATVGAIGMSIFTGVVPGYVLSFMNPSPSREPGLELVVTLIGGYCIGFPFGSASGTYFIGKLFHQDGTFWGSLAGGAIGMAIGISTIVLITSTGASEHLLGFYAEWCLPPILPQVGAVIGYNLSRKSSSNINQQGSILGIPQLGVLMTRRPSHSKDFKVRLTLLRIGF